MGAFFRKVKKNQGSTNKKDRWTANMWLALDQLGGSILGIHHDETISSHLGKCERGDFEYPFWGKPVHWFLEKVDPGHCKNAIEEDEGFPDGRLYGDNYEAEGNEGMFV